MKKLIPILISLLLVLAACGGEIATEEPPDAPPVEVQEEPPEEEPLEEEPAEEEPPEPEVEAEAEIFVDPETLFTLQNTVNLPRDPNDIALRLRGFDEIPPLPPATPELEVGAQEEFILANEDPPAPKTFTITATLRYISEHVYFWVQNDAFNHDAEETEEFEKEIKSLLNKFESVYNKNREIFGNEASPGIDGNEHIYILYARGVGFNVGGYFSSRDSLNPAVEPASNAHETFVVSARNVDLADDFADVVLAHEFQHMIHQNQDADEEGWINEGLSELAVTLNLIPSDGRDRLYTQATDQQMNYWPDGGDTLPYYGASFLYFTYFYDRFGPETVRELVAQEKNGMDGIDAVLEELEFFDSLTGEQITADDLILDFGLTNHINDDEVGDGRYFYDSYKENRRAKVGETDAKCEPGVLQERDVHQYGVDYIRFICEGPQTLLFDGAESVQVLPVENLSGEYFFYSNKGDSMDNTLTQTFDFTEVNGPLTFTFWTNYYLEKNFDYVYLVASTDGEKWEMVETPSGTSRGQEYSNLGFGYTGYSGPSRMDWIEESFDISQFAGQVVQLRFEYITDANVNGEGFLLDDISIPEIDYFSDLEVDNGGWEAVGFVRIKNILPQTFRLALFTDGENPSVEYIDLGVNNKASITLEFGEDVKNYVLVVVGTTRYTWQLADYTFDYAP